MHGGVSCSTAGIPSCGKENSEGCRLGLMSADACILIMPRELNDSLYSMMAPPRLVEEGRQTRGQWPPGTMGQSSIISMQAGMLLIIVHSPAIYKHKYGTGMNKNPTYNTNNQHDQGEWKKCSISVVLHPHTAPINHRLNDIVMV